MYIQVITSGCLGGGVGRGRGERIYFIKNIFLDFPGSAGVKTLCFQKIKIKLGTSYLYFCRNTRIQKHIIGTQSHLSHLSLIMVIITMEQLFLTIIINTKLNTLWPSISILLEICPRKEKSLCTFNIPVVMTMKKKWQEY